MAVDSLAGLKLLFGRWRKRKRYSREPVPKDLMDRARRAIEAHGVRAVFLATGLQHRYLSEKGRPKTDATSHLQPRIDIAQGKHGKIAPRPAIPAYSRIAFPLATSGVPLVEAETPLGLKVRVFSITPETIALLSALGGSGRSP